MYRRCCAFRPLGRPRPLRPGGRPHPDIGGRTPLQAIWGKIDFDRGQPLNERSLNMLMVTNEVKTTDGVLTVVKGIALRFGLPPAASLLGVIVWVTA
jgi:hypothetical protein